MKKIIAAALSMLVGAFGYTIVDSAIENRVATLESEVVELREIISSYHNNITEAISNTINEPSSTRLTPATIRATTTAYPEQILGYRYDYDGNFYYSDDKECWQEGAGYNEIYDNFSPAAAMFIDQIRVHFEYENKDWMIQLWKGQYGWEFIGAETGIYTAPAGTYKGGNGDPNNYNCADKEDWLYMHLDCYWSENNTGNYKKIFTREYDEYWWATGFVKGQLTKYSKPRTEVKASNRITFKSEEMANLFVQGLKEAGFVRASGSDQLVDDSYYQSGEDVWLLWASVQYNSFVGYTDTTTSINNITVAPTTTQRSTTTRVEISDNDDIVTRPSGVTIIDEGSTIQRPTITQTNY